MRMDKKQQAGYTLIELLIYILIAGILLGALTSFFGLAEEARIKNQTIAEVDQQGIFAVETITQSLRNANSITLPLAGASSTLTGLTLTNASSIAAIFTVINSTLTEQDGNLAPVNLTNSEVAVSNFTVKNLSQVGTLGSVEVSLTLNRVNPSGRSEYSYQQTFTATGTVR